MGRRLVRGEARHRRGCVRVAVLAAIAALGVAPAAAATSSPTIVVRLTTGPTDGISMPLYLSLHPKVVKAGTKVTIEIHNLDRTSGHQVIVNNVRSPFVGAGGKARMRVRFARTGIYVVAASLPGSESGGSGALTVVR